MAVLLARLRAQLRQHAQSEDAIFTIGPYTFRPAAKMLLDQTGKTVLPRRRGGPQISQPRGTAGDRP
jgi:hypothetical protein